ncbi:MAG TPA: TadE/TadG family type IV pilus assembly protein [Terriglobia bacterium]|nr:TadE/TadG family type IV pilus assembly protein [Terriglobia bacterium]
MFLRSCRGQATVETALVLVVGILPLTFGLIAFAEIAWTYHALATLTRQGARYAGTHCWQDSSGSNVVSWMQANAPAFPDRPQLATGGVQIQVNYWTHDPATHQSLPFSCAAGCSAQCVPDSVTVSISQYQFSHFFTLLGLQPLQVPTFSTTVEMESAGGNPETAISSP